MNSKSGIVEPAPENNRPEAENDLPTGLKDNKTAERADFTKDTGEDNTDTGDTVAISFNINKKDKLHRLFKATLLAEPTFESIREKIKKNRVNKMLFGAWDIIGKMEAGKESKTSKVPGMVREVRERLDKIHGEIMRISKPLNFRDSLKKSSAKLHPRQLPPKEFKPTPISYLHDSQVTGKTEDDEKKTPDSESQQKDAPHREDGFPEVY